MVPDSTEERLNAALVTAGMEPLSPDAARRFGIYLSLILRWNQHLNLTAARAEDTIIIRHLVECIRCARAIPQDVETLLDFGSGAGLPGIPISLCRPEIVVTLAESRGKKAAFLGEATRVLEIGSNVYGHRAESLRTVFDCVTMRAVDKMPQAVASAAKLVSASGWLALMTTNADLPKLQAASGSRFSWERPQRLPFGEERILALGRRVNSAA